MAVTRQLQQGPTWLMPAPTLCTNSSSLSLMVTFLSERSSCAKVERWIQVGIALRAILEASKVGAWLRRALVCIGGQGEALPLPASVARERQLGWHAVPTLPEAGVGDSHVDWRTDATQSRPYQEATRAARGAAPTSRYPRWEMILLRRGAHLSPTSAIHFLWSSSNSFAISGFCLMRLFFSERSSSS